MKARTRQAAIGALALAVASAGLTAGGAATAVSDRAKPAEVELLGASSLPPGLDFRGTTVGGLSSISHDAERGVYYAISDDPDDVRVYTLRIDVADGDLASGDITVSDVVFLQPPDDEVYAAGTVDPEGLTLTDDDTLVVTSEGVPDAGIAPWIREYSLDGSYLRDLEVPDRFAPGTEQGVRTNLGFESAAVTPNGRFLFTGNEGALVQDGPAATPDNGSVVRIMRHSLRTGDVQRSHAYPVGPVTSPPVPPDSFSVNGLVELLPVNNQFLLSMERSFSVGVGNSVTLHKVALPGADDVSDVESLAEADVRPAGKAELLDLTTLGLTLGNLEGMTLGPVLPDGRRSLVLVADNNFTPGEASQFLLLALSPGR